MDKRRLKTFRDRLLERREGLIGIVEQAELSSRERDSEATQDPADMAANAYTKELMVSMNENDRKLLLMIDEALVRIEDGEFGECIRCGEPILERRLEAIPWARYCLNCQDLFEKGLLTEDEE
jgi:DnaK suppressor protein